jgi:hypothetical protein
MLSHSIVLMLKYTFMLCSKLIHHADSNSLIAQELARYVKAMNQPVASTTTSPASSQPQVTVEAASQAATSPPSSQPVQSTIQPPAQSSPQLVAQPLAQPLTQPLTQPLHPLYYSLTQPAAVTTPQANPPLSQAAAEQAWIAYYQHILGLTAAQRAAYVSPAQVNPASQPLKFIHYQPRTQAAVASPASSQSQASTSYQPLLLSSQPVQALFPQQPASSSQDPALDTN